ncbi:hypothetical protein [Nitrosospira sp. NRS527]|uniref:hypothetical protein n=1 Tax=Nitrosospira sp. NRS527 TaxID=155925 RepID=UPI001AF9D023|nr:hypothetical protein [Nitrosospira sp. NRS527]BCT66978.1 hypothetical protein NNRS527_00553 [Nitrosospira sp. NRS527]
MSPTINFSNEAKIREFIAQLDQAIEMAKDLHKQINCITQHLEERFPSRLAA